MLFLGLLLFPLLSKTLLSSGLFKDLDTLDVKYFDSCVVHIFVAALLHFLACWNHLWNRVKPLAALRITVDHTRQDRDPKMLLRLKQSQQGPFKMLLQYIVLLPVVISHNFMTPCGVN